MAITVIEWRLESEKGAREVCAAIGERGARQAQGHHFVVGVHALEGAFSHGTCRGLHTAVFIGCTDHPKLISVVGLAQQAVWCGRTVVGVEFGVESHLEETLARGARRCVDNASLDLQEPQ